jgi:DNA-binding transcriptional ArsR family regulator
MNSVLEYVVPSSERRALLKTLHSHKDGLTVRQLASLARVAYSSAHREVRQLTRAGLVHVRRLGPALVCRWKADDASARALETLLGAGADDAEVRAVFSNLKRLGAPLVREARSSLMLSPGETMARALKLARHHPEVARVWPVVFAKNQAEVTFEELVLVARRTGEKRALGFMLSLTATLLGDSSLQDRAGQLKDRRTRHVEDFFLLEHGERAQRLAAANTPPVAKEWLFRMNMPMESFESLFRKFVGSHEEV